jgi:hypothetical protein
MLKALMVVSSRDAQERYVMVPASPSITFTFANDEIARSRCNIKLAKTVGNDIPRGSLIPAMFVFPFNGFSHFELGVLRAIREIIRDFYIIASVIRVSALESQAL